MVYIEYRLCKAGYSGPPLFSYEAVDLIAANSKGVPRIINNLCFNALTLGFAKRQTQIDAATVYEVMADLDLESLTTHRSDVPELSEDSLVSFDGISPSNELTYQDFHDAVRSAWGNGAPIKSKDRPADESPKWTEPDSMPQSLDAIFRMRLHADEKSPSSFELDHPQGEVDVTSSSSLPVSTASTLPLTDPGFPQAQQHESQGEESLSTIAVADVAGRTAEPSASTHQAVQLEVKNIHQESPLQPAVHVTSPHATEDARRQKTTELNSSFVPSHSKPSTVSIRGRADLWAPWRAALRTLQNVYKKEKSTADTGRAIRGGTVVAIAFALTVSGLVFAWQHHEFMQPLTKAVPVAPSPGSLDPSQPSAAVLDSQDSQMLHAKVSPPPANTQQKPVVVTIEYGQTLGEVSLQHLGQFNPEVTREIQKSNPEIKDPDLIIAGTQILLPSPPIHSDIRTPSSEEVPSREEGQK